MVVQAFVRVITFISVFTEAIHKVTPLTALRLSPTKSLPGTQLMMVSLPALPVTNSSQVEPINRTIRSQHLVRIRRHGLSRMIANVGFSARTEVLELQGLMRPERGL